MKKTMITQERLKELLHYDEHSGVFIRLKCTARCHTVGEKVGYPRKNRGYFYCRLDRNLYSMHRLAWLYVKGSFPKENIDHINHCVYDNRISNLRDVSFAENMRNKSKYSTNTSAITGVNWHKREKIWYARIQENGRRVTIGRYNCKEDAGRARTEFIKDMNFHKNHGI